MATKRETRPRRRPAKKVANSKIAEAQKAAQEKAKDNPHPAGEGSLGGPAKLKAGKPTSPQADPNQKTYKGSGYSKTPDRTKKSGPGDSGPVRDPLLAGLSTGIPGIADKRTLSAMAAARPKDPISNPALYGTASNKKRAANLSDRLTAMNASITQAKGKGNAVYMGLDPNAKTAKIRTSGPNRMDENGKDYTEEKVGDLVLTKDELMSWLSDETKVAQIKAAAEKAGFTIQSYDDVSKLWTSVVSQAASSYSLTNKKVTPWALLTLRGKYLVNGKPKDRVTTSTNIDEMDPATARLMFEKTAQDQLGRAPTKAEVDDFIAKAQTIALKNPAVTTTTQKIGLDGNVTDQTSKTVGGGQAVSDQAQVAALDKARQSEDYASYQAAGNYFPMLFQALSAPV